MKTFKKVLDILYVILLPLTFLFITILIFKKCSSDPEIPEGYVLVEQASLDSLEVIANSIPDTVLVADTTRPDTVIKWKEHGPAPVVKTDSGYFYQDSIQDENVAIFINDSISNTGIINHRQVGYKLFIPLQIDRRITITQKVPVPVKMIEYRTLQKNEFIGAIGFGGGLNGFAVSGEVGLIRNNKLYGLQYLKTEHDFLMLKVGIKF